MKQGYGLGEIIKNGIALIYTRVFWKGARLIRLPFYFRGNRKKFVFGEGFTVGYGCRFELYYDEKEQLDGNLLIGSNCKFGDRVHISSCKKITIGNNCLLASNILITDNEHGTYKGENASKPEEIPDKRKLSVEEVSIGNNVWIGENVVVLPGVHIGNGCIIGANSVVNKSYDDNVIIAGAPARIIKKYVDDTKQWENIN
ncbi:MAG: acetyltransferase [Lachnospiraceae bacterium]|nr:acetyltransferase [Lachnospiraceae bacterium]